ncbi:protoporphyrinogen oxidase HemJ [Halomonas sp. McH1-25]|uniref:protoporphyrinogen oxidase HemJ n=1 Tax=unclassified Halomonas TaxID=2609666 RepID=UPI001EF5C35C|nr:MULTISPECIES: protoporphyrinogen oxidase HemJ [unclassified Halomonas]MCG7599637.1 protoporphyrinogen oxidase HemJ [Halomonas sp. McH1-25]MCP1342557.1 protoporphyrinogen oxidase HemJ [Halomonas sp. FL8]MCP1361409.1 protoporphyrinogen oxidase HemJ [Halomonas sp. BBD45]MCP1364611.1 protoporphyrinogen oxidase HemJ [Halomonas sp. BBD48]
MYLWVKAFHLVAMVTWFAALFYLPRLFVYHAMARDKNDTQAMDYFTVMERKLFRGIMTPSMVAVIALGAWLLFMAPGFLSQGWLHTKLLLVLLLVGYHHMCLAYMKRLAAGTCTKSHTYFRWFNEAPVIALILIVILAMVKPY